MKLGIALNIAGNPKQADVDLLTDHIRLGDLAEPLGFSSLFAFEHHFSDYLISPCPTSLLTYFAGRSNSILLGASVIVLPWHQPLLVAERMLLLDALSGQRTIYGFGTGRAPGEFDAMAVDRRHAQERWHEALAIIRQAMTGKPVCFQGRFNSVSDIVLRPRPCDDHIRPFFAPAGQVRSAQRAAAEGMGLILSADLGLERLTQLSAAHRAASCLAELPRSILFAPIFLGDSDAQAEAVVAGYCETDRRMAARHYADGPIESKCNQSKKGSSDHIVGSASTCLEALRKLQCASRCDHIVLEVSFGAMPAAMAEANMRRVAAELLPIILSW